MEDDMGSCGPFAASSLSCCENIACEIAATPVRPVPVDAGTPGSAGVIITDEVEVAGSRTTPSSLLETLTTTDCVDDDAAVELSLPSPSSNFSDV